MRYVLIIILFLVVTSLANNTAYSHPGNTASDGCHYCRTNCDKWGVEWNARHCHNAKTPSKTTTNYSNTTKEEDDNSWKYLLGAGAVGIGAYLYGKRNKG